MHGQDFPEVFWIEQGEALHCVNGQHQPLEKGHLVFMRPEDQHALTTSANSQGFVLVNLAFPASTLDFLRARYFASEDRWFWHPGVLPESTHLDSARLAWLSRWVDRLDADESSLLNLEIFLTEILRELQSDRRPHGQIAGPDWLSSALQRLPDPGIFEGDSAALARVAGFTPQHLNACLKRFHGRTTTEVLNAARMDFAAKELRTSTKKILEISLDCGFKNLSHFYSLFKAQTGKTPRQYRKSHQHLLR